MRIFIVFCFIMMVSAEDSNPLPIDAQKIVNVLGVKIADLQRQAAKDLKKVQDAATKNGDLDAAIAVRHVVTGLEEQLATNNDVLVSKVDPSVPEKAVLGRWMYNAGYGMIIEPDGIAHNIDGDEATWTITGKQLVIRQRSGYTVTFGMPDKDVMVGLSNNGSPIRATRVKQ